MKTRLAILVALAATAGVSAGAYAAEAINPAVPGNPGAGLGEIGSAPALFPSEQGAFKGLEVAKQLVESWILQNGCDEKSFDLKVKTDASGKGLLTVDAVNLAIKLGTPAPSYDGRTYDVSGSGTLGGLYVPGVKSHGSFNIGSEMQELTTDWAMQSPNTGDYDAFRGTIIKDYWRLADRLPIPGNCEADSASADVDYFSNACTPVNTVIDYGYQQIQKHGYIAAKWWQQSQAWRQNGVRSGTFWKVARVAPSGDSCEITVKLQGTPGAANTANKQGFNQVGVIEVGLNGGESAGPWFKK